MVIHFLWEVQNLGYTRGTVHRSRKWVTLKRTKFWEENKDRSVRAGGQEETNIHTWYSQAVIHPRTNKAKPWLVAQFGQGRTIQGCPPPPFSPQFGIVPPTSSVTTTNWGVWRLRRVSSYPVNLIFFRIAVDSASGESATCPFRHR